MRSVLITGGAGFIGSNFVNFWSHNFRDDQLIVLDALTYAGNLANIKGVIDQENAIFVRGDICDKELVAKLIEDYSIDTVVNFAAESHVDRSIAAPDDFLQTNIIGTHNLLSVALSAWKDAFDGKRFHHISTDEVYGDLSLSDPAFTEKTPFFPRSPYAATKASSDHLVKAYNVTYGLPITITNCSNNYGPFHFPEKFIPLVITNALDGKALPIYGTGLNVRDWLYVDDHCRAISTVIREGVPGETYNVGGDNEVTNIDLVKLICSQLDKRLEVNPDLVKKFPKSAIATNSKSEALIQFVADRPGHDRRYAINGTKISIELGFTPSIDFMSGINLTLDWYLQNEQWWRAVQGGEHQRWIEQQYG